MFFQLLVILVVVNIPFLRAHYRVRLQFPALWSQLILGLDLGLIFSTNKVKKCKADMLLKTNSLTPDT